jgi:hypothetical protein
MQWELSHMGSAIVNALALILLVFLNRGSLSTSYVMNGARLQIASLAENRGSSVGGFKVTYLG